MLSQRFSCCSTMSSRHWIFPMFCFLSSRSWKQKGKRESKSRTNEYCAMFIIVFQPLALATYDKAAEQPEREHLSSFQRKFYCSQAFLSQRSRNEVSFPFTKVHKCVSEKVKAFQGFVNFHVRRKTPINNEELLVTIAIFMFSCAIWYSIALGWTISFADDTRRDERFICKRVQGECKQSVPRMKSFVSLADREAENDENSEFLCNIERWEKGFHARLD